MKKVVLEMDYQYWTNDEARDSEFGDLFEYVQLPMSKVKLEYIRDELIDKDFRTVYFKKLAYTSDFSKVKYNIKTKLTKEYRDSISVRLRFVMLMDHIWAEAFFTGRIIMITNVISWFRSGLKMI